MMIKLVIGDVGQVEEAVRGRSRDKVKWTVVSAEDKIIRD